MGRYWISWISGNNEKEGCSSPPFQTWISGILERPNYGLTEEQYIKMNQLDDIQEIEEYIELHGRKDFTICAMVDADNEDQIWEVVKKYYPDYEKRFCDQRRKDDETSERFPNFQNKTKLFI